MSSKIKYSLTSCPPFNSFTSGSLQNTLVRAPPRNLGKWELSCSASHGVWLPCFWAESKRINSTGVLVRSGRENKTKHNETTAYVHEQQIKSSSFSEEWTAKADGKHPLLLQSLLLSSQFWLETLQVPELKCFPLSQVWKGIFLMQTWPLKGWAASTVPDLWSSAPCSCSETPAGVQRTFQQPLCPVHRVGWLKPRLLLCKFMVAPHSSFFHEQEDHQTAQE